MQSTDHVKRNGTVRPIELSAEGSSSEHWLLLDVRTPGEFTGAHIEGSVNVPLGDLSRSVDAVCSHARGRSVALVCRTGKRAEEAKRLLAAAPLEDLRVLEGGVVGWESAGYSLVRGEGGMSLERQVRIAAGFLVFLGVVLGFLVHPGFFGISGFVGAGLMFAGITDTCAMGMVIAKMPWNRAKITNESVACDAK